MLTDTGRARGHYSASNRFQVLEQDRGRDVSVEHTRQMAVRERAKKLSVETNRRRKALESKKKAEAQREAKRRQEVLEERSQRQREATNRYQRLNKAGARRHAQRSSTAPAYPGAPLQEGVHMARGYRLDSPHIYGSGTPSLDDVLQMVGVPSSLSLKYGQGYPSYQPNGMVPASTYPTTHYGGSYIDTNVNVTPVIEPKGYATPTHAALSSVANQGRVDSRTSLLEQEIAEQQQQLIAQQQRTLQEFSQAIQNEAKSTVSGDTLQRSGSLSSVDSLEDQRGVDDTAPHRHKPPQTASTQQDLKNNPSNYSLYHNNVLTRGNYDKKPAEAHNVNHANNTAHSTAVAYNPPFSAMEFSGVAFNGIVSTADASSHSATPSMQSQSHSTAVSSRATRDGDGQHEGDGSSQAWSNSPVSKPPPQQHASAPTASPAQRPRPYSARTTATAVTIAPAVSYQVGAHEPQRKPVDKGVPSNPVASGGMAEDQGLARHGPGLRMPGYDDRMGDAQGEEGQASDGHPKAESPPKSILKRYKTDTPPRERRPSGLAAAVMKDSLEIGKQSGIRSPKKSVRWTDMAYSDDGGVETQQTTDSTAHAVRKPRIISSVDARTVQERLGGKTDGTVTGTPPRPRSGRANSAKDKSSVAMKNNRFPTGSSSNTQPAERDKPVKAAPVTQNGIRLDKTPTDDEINWLWDKVRTCLNTREESAPSQGTGRQSSSATQQHDQRITANLRVAPPTDKPRFSQYNDTLRRHVIVPRSVSGSNSAAPLQQSALFQQRRPTARAPGPPRPSEQRGPVPSQQGPARAGTGGIQQQQQGPDVTESLAAFQQAEQLVQENAEDADIVAVIEQQRPTHHMAQHKAHPSAISIEEAQILKSLDRLNARLKTVTAEMNGSFNPVYPVMPPRPPTHGTSFRGHRPLSSRPGVSGAVKPNHRARAHSADRSSIRMGHHR